MTSKISQRSLTLDYPIEQVQLVLGPKSVVLRQLEEKYCITILDRGQRLLFEGEVSQVDACYHEFTKRLTTLNLLPNNSTTPSIKSKQFRVFAKSTNQSQLIHSLNKHAINFIVGPAGTGKTFLAVASALKMLLDHEVERIVITRPIVESGEKLGFLPGDIAQKVDPYLKPIYDSLYDLIGTQTANKLLESNTIEITPFAYMRGRTFKNTFIIADECQNTSPQQMKMLLTRLGMGSRLAITGDPSQIDLHPKQANGLFDAMKTLENIDQISFNHLSSHDSVRHPLVKQIVDAYEKHTH